MNNSMVSRRRTLAKIMALLLAVMMLFSMIACAETETPEDSKAPESTKAPEGENSQGGEEPEETEPVETRDENGYYDDLVPDENFNDSINILYWEDQEHEEFISDTPSPDLILNSLYFRNEEVKARLGITFEFTPHVANYGNRAKWNDYVGQSLDAGKQEIDILAAYSMSIAMNSLNNYCYNLLSDDCDVLSFDRAASEWWPEALIQESVIYDKLYFCSGDISANTIYMMYTMFFNTSMVEEYNIEDPRKLVEANNWTYDKFFELCDGIYDDVDASGSKTAGDLMAYSTGDGIHMDPWLYSTGVRVMEIVDDEFVISQEFITGEKIINTVNKINTLIYSTDFGMVAGGNSTPFNNGLRLFCIDRARAAIRYFSNEDLSYSVVPQPKYSTDTEDYVTTMGNPFTLYAIPNDGRDDYSMIATVLEVMASESYRQVTPAIFETTLKIKKMDDELSWTMFDIIRASIVFDLGRLYEDALMVQGMFRNQITSNTNSWAYAMKTQKKALQTALDTKILPAYED